ncbi:KN motif and ankyrin repeat domain-containing protein 2 [Polyodon spathula]|uniref:KN motif and ankyrin repeat domain-containing protein 2 n=1 Tax=Polyodon spathula TaxID=7913 RepID=UPI001B7DE324|nr:KN motif and ankyrin repeat domain-containing protein 2 [Polyodon spathula]XP_041091645.1 KN motif and ankyrin repeat domain-containing protein 2 [Polyodon spathula]XP_041091646.1 KN motif and ankyrin repeat domain-containing protein 2 [Polyodon spathula]XP_041091647.1 KN motif and ankyrin repeat domain-containing protein 2 [Polyodon spathula]
MAQVLHMDPNFPGKSNPTSPSALQGKEQELPYSVETPYGYRLDLDFLKYVNDIEKGNTIKKVPIHRRPRYSSLPRGSGYTGSWWTSTESLCSNISMDSRHSSFSYCAPGYHGSYRADIRPPFLAGGFNARVEKTLLDARKKLEQNQTDSAGRQQPFSNLGSMQSSVSGSASSLVGSSLNQPYSKSQNGTQGGQFTPMSSGLSTPVSPTPAHLQHVREQMAVALRKIRELEEQVKVIPVQQVKISVLQEEKRQLSVQLKSQKFLGHSMSFGKPRPRGELYIDIPEEDSTGGGGKVLSPTLANASRQDSGCEIEDTVIVGGARQLGQMGGRKEVRSVGVGTEAVEEGRGCVKDGGSSKAVDVRHVGVVVKEQDLGLSSEATQAEVEQQRQNTEGLKTKMTVLETQLKKALQELKTAHQRLEQQGKETTERSQDAKLSMADAVIMTSVGWQDLQETSNKIGCPGEAPGLQTVVSFNQQPQKKEQRTVGIQVYTLEQPAVVGLRKCQEVALAADQAAFAHRPMRAEAPAACSVPNVVMSTPPGVLESGAHSRAQEEARSPAGVPYIVYRSNETIETTFPVHGQAGAETGGHQVEKNSLRIGEGEGEARSMDGAAGVPDTSPELPIAICSREVREVLPKCEVSSSVPVSSPAVVMETVSAVQLVSNQQAPLCQRLKEVEAENEALMNAAAGSEELQEPDSPSSSLKSIMKRPDQLGPSDSPTTKKNLQFAGVNGGYESSSSEESSSESSSEENESEESEYHEASERLTEAGTQAQGSKDQTTPAQDPPAPAPAPAPAQAESPQTLRESQTTPTPDNPSPQEKEEAKEREGTQDSSVELRESLVSACTVLQKALGEPNAFSHQEPRAAYTAVLQEWLRVSCHKAADPEVVRQHMAVFRALSPQLLAFIVNMADGNGNTALHYTVSHSNFAVVKLLLDTGLCNPDKQNKAGYTAIMLTALAAFRSECDLETVMQLLRMGDVNAKASQAGQTALMLAVSHGRIDMVRALLACGAHVNLQDHDGSTALMCACEHGHVDIVKQLLAVPGCDATLTDNDGSSALSIALEASQNDIAVLLYAHLNFAKPPSPVAQKSLLGTSPPTEAK